MTVENPNLDISTPENQRNIKLRRQASMASVFVAIFLILLKFAAYLITGSVSILTSLTDSMIDFLASAITLFSVVQASTPADKQHRFGYGKMESLAAIIQAVFILASAGYLFIQSVDRFIHPKEISDIGFAMYVMAISIVCTFFLVFLQKYVIRKTNSVAIKADSLHYQGDMLMNISVIISLLLVKYSGYSYFDPAFGVLVSLLLLNSAYSISKESLAVLIDQELSEGDRHTIEIIVKAHPKAKAVHDLRTRFSGYKTFIEFHMEVDGNLTVKEAHAATEDVERELYKLFPDADVVIHQEPYGIKDYRIDDEVK